MATLRACLLFVCFPALQEANALVAIHGSGSKAAEEACSMSHRP